MQKPAQRITLIGSDRFEPLRIGEIGLAKGSAIMRAVLGSCIALVLYTPGGELATMAHILLPSGVGLPDSITHPGKYADKAVDTLVSLLEGQGLTYRDVAAKLAGGANMFAGIGTKLMSRIGPENDRMILERLAAHNIPITGRDTGGLTGRTVEFDVAASTMTVSVNGRSTTRI